MLVIAFQHSVAERLYSYILGASRLRISTSFITLLYVPNKAERVVNPNNQLAAAAVAAAVAR
jgi:hypothetical protein